MYLVLPNKRPDCNFILSKFMSWNTSISYFIEFFMEKVLVKQFKCSFFRPILHQFGDAVLGKVV